MTWATRSSQSSSASRAPSAAERAVAKAWERGVLGWKILEYQRPLYEDIKRQLWGIEPDGAGVGSYKDPRGKQRKYIPEIHRKYGKSTVCGIIASELCRQKENARVFWGAETQKQVTLFLKPIMDEISADCPERLKPRWYRQDGMWVWPGTESQIIVGGCEDEAKCNRLRGPACDLFIIDEAGQIALLHYLYTSVVLWMISRSGGRVLMPSTPATTPAHPFTAFCVLAESGESGHARQTVYDSVAMGDPCFTEEQLAELAKECGGKDTPQWQREAEVKRVVDASRAIVPEFTANEAAIVAPMCLSCGLHFDKHDETERCADGKAFKWAHEAVLLDDGQELVGPPAYRDCYVSADPGDSPSLFALSYGYWWFQKALLVIEDENEHSKPTTEDVAEGVKATEERLWAKHFAQMRLERRDEDMCRPYKRVTDIDPRMTQDMPKLHGVDFVTTRKDDAEAQVNELRLWCKHTKIAVHPRCRRTIAHMKAGIKTKNGKDWEFIEGFGHFDFIASLVYLVRNVDRARNPWPEVPFGISPRTHWFSPKAPVATVPREYQDLAAAWPSFRPGGG